MSYSISIEVSELPPPHAVLAALRPRPVSCVERPQGLDEWPIGTLHLHTIGQSTRGVELIISPGEVSARMVSLANAADWQLAFDVIAAIAARADARAVGEDGTEASTGALRAGFEEVVLREAATGLLSLLELSARDDVEGISFDGPVRRVHVGPRVLAELGAEEPVRALAALLERIRRIQYIEHEGFELVESSDLGALLGLGASIPLSLWEPTTPTAFGPTPLVGASHPDGNLYLPVAELPALLGSRFQWLDEQQFTIAPTPDAELAALYKRARKVSVDLSGGKRKRWKFWKRS